MNYAVQILMSLLVQAGMLEEIYCNRLPPGHTHIDIDGRNALYTSYLFGRKEGGGKVAQVNTLSQFDEAVSKAFISDKFKIIRRTGVLNCKEAWNKWLGYSRFGSTRHSSKEAQAQGGRQEEPMCMHFFIGKEPANLGKVLMRYKFREDDRYWAPYGHEGIPCFSSNAPATQADMLRHPGIRTPKAWPEKDAIAAHLQCSRRLSVPEKEEWKAFFSAVPVDLEDFVESQLFEWTVPGLVQRFLDAKYVAPQPTPALGDGLGDSPRPEMPDERVLWTGFTATDARREAKTRSANYEKQRRAYDSKKLAESAASKTSQAKRGRKTRAQTQEDTDSSDDEGMAAGDMGVVFVGDCVLFSPDKASREVDARSGYKLGLNIGQVRDMDEDRGNVQLWWFFSSCAAWTPKTIFVPWRDSKTHQPYMDWIDASSLLQDSWGALIKIEMTKVSGREGYARHVLARDSYNAIMDVLGERRGSDGNGNGDEDDNDDE